ncbi:MAG: hypothetical protein MJE68_16150, partial [Proteobacteria bacterium]|nr:hypothetical protein [Pseudomonadota bacterium]
VKTPPPFPQTLIYTLPLLHVHTSRCWCYSLRSKAAVMATLLCPGKEFKITHQEMIKGISRGQMGKKYRYHDELVVPIIENTPEERDLTVFLRK